MKSITLILTLGIALSLQSQQKPYSWIETTETDSIESQTVWGECFAIHSDQEYYVKGINGNLASGGQSSKPCLAKYDSKGKLIWATFYEGTASDWSGRYEFHGLGFDNDENLIGIFNGHKLDFDGNTRRIRDNVALVKFDSSGAALWVNGFNMNLSEIIGKVITEDNDIILLISGQVVKHEEITIEGSKSDILMIINGQTGDIELLDYMAHTNLGELFGETSIYNAGNGTIACINSRKDSAESRDTYLTLIDYVTNTVVTDTPLGRIFYDNFESNQYGTVERVWSYNHDSKIAYVTGYARETGMPILQDTILGVDEVSPFIAKLDLGNGSLLAKSVFHNHGEYEPIYYVEHTEEQISLFLMYEDSVTNVTSAYTANQIESIPSEIFLRHTLIENYSSDLQLNYFNRAALPVTIKSCYDAVHTSSGELTMLFSGGEITYFNENIVQANSKSILANIGQFPLAIGDKRQDLTLSVFPNPATTQINIRSNRGLEKVVAVDVFGRQIQLDSRNSNCFDISNLPAGMYILLIYEIGGMKSIERVIKSG
jgi:hypothetical protein